jgi:hypothetical protein
MSGLISGPEYYVNILSFVDRDLLEPGSSVLTHNKVHFHFRSDLVLVFRAIFSLLWSRFFLLLGFWQMIPTLLSV